jgi:hypothetical protein
MREAELQLERFWMHFHQLIDEDFGGEERPWKLAGRALVIACFAITRAVAQRAASNKEIPVLSVAITPSRSDCFQYEVFSGRTPLLLKHTEPLCMSVGSIAGLIAVSPRLMAVTHDATLPVGVLFEGPAPANASYIFVPVATLMTIPDPVDFCL